MILKLFMIVSCGMLTLSAAELVQPNLEGFRYPLLARSARIGGTVQFLVKADSVQLLSGHPLLVPAARSNLEKWAVPYASQPPLSVTYVFRITGDIRIETVEVDRPIGNAFDRFFLHLSGRPVTRRIKEQVCVGPKDSPAAYKNVTKDGFPSIEIDIESGGSCLNTDVVAIAAVKH